MGPSKSFGVLFVVGLLFFPPDQVTGIGANWGTQSTHRLPPEIVVRMLKDNGIQKVKLFDADYDTLKALGKSGLEVMVGIPNDMLSTMGSLKAAEKWVSKNVSVHINDNSVNIRFHRLPEFDQGKRSCRRRLAGHNERRRKPPPGSLLSTRYGSLSSSIFENNSRSGSFLVDFAIYPNLTEVTWSNTRTSVRGWDNQATASGKFLQSPWLNSSENSTSDLILQGSAGSASNSGPSIPSGNCFPGVSDSSGALSLLSNESWGSRSQSSSLGVNSLVNTDDGYNIQPSGSHAVHVNHYSGPQWGSKGNEGSSSSHSRPPNVGLDQIYHDAVNQYSAETGKALHSGRQFMELDHSKGYDSSVQDVQWTL